MRRCWVACLLIGGLAVSTGCVSGHNPSVLSMKGYELYSWPAGQDWDFALLIGTNRLKTLEEITAPERTLHGVEAVKAALHELPANEEVFWMGPIWLQQSQGASGNMAIPPSPVRDEIASLCLQLGVRLAVNE